MMRAFISSYAARLLISGFVILLLVLSHQLPSMAFIPSTDFSMKVIPRISYDTSTRLFCYSYQLTNAQHSRQSIQDFGIDYQQFDISNVKSVQGWDPLEDFGNRPVLVWYYDGESNTPIPPGASKSGFSFCSPRKPSERQFFARSSYEYIANDDIEGQELAEQGKFDFFNNSIKVNTLGPGTLPTRDPLIELASLRAYLTQSNSYGWISSQGILRSLEAKIDAARRSLEQGKNKTAKNQIEAFINEAEAQRGKQLSESASSLLVAYASFLVSLLP